MTIAPRALALAAALSLTALTAAADTLADGTTIRADDAGRLAMLDESYGSALRQALEGGAPADVAVLTRALSGAPRDVAPEAMAGDWSCRVIKVGKINPVTAYDPFRCRVTVAGGAATFEKLSGSQRVRGTIHRDADRLVLLGVGYIAGDPAPDYASLPESLDPSATPQVTSNPGIVQMTGADSGRILFPYPTLESTMDVLVLSR